MIKEFFERISDFIAYKIEYNRKYNSRMRELKLKNVSLQADLDYASKMQKKIDSTTHKKSNKSSYDLEF